MSDEKIFGTSPVRNAYIKITNGNEDELIRDLLLSCSTKFTEEEMKEIEQNAPWIEIKDDEIVFSKGMIEILLKKASEYE